MDEDDDEEEVDDYASDSDSEEDTWPASAHSRGRVTNPPQKVKKFSNFSRA